MIDDKKKTVKFLVEDECAIRWDLRFIKKIICPALIELTLVGFQVMPVLKDALSKFLEVSVITN